MNADNGKDHKSREQPSSLYQRLFQFVERLTDLGDARNFHLFIKDASQLRQDILKFQHLPQTLPEHFTPPQRHYDEWIVDIFRDTESAIPRETLLDNFLNRFSRQWRLAEGITRFGPWVFVLEAEFAQKQFLGYRGWGQRGLIPNLWKNFCEITLPGCAEDPLLRHVLQDHKDIDLWYAPSFAGELYRGIFDGVLDVKRRSRGEPDFWINAVALPGDAYQPSRGVFILYPNVGDLFSPVAPSGASQDGRILFFLNIAYRQLESQVKNLARETQQARAEMVSALAPGLMHHEIGFNVRSLAHQAQELKALLTQLNDDYEERRLIVAENYAQTIDDFSQRLYRITDAFNNLEKRASAEAADLNHIMEECLLLLHFRLGKAGVELKWDEATFEGITFTTDVVLLTQAVLNILNNAINAIEENPSPQPPHFIRLEAQEEEDLLVLDISNNGPPILPKHAANIFQRGYSTRRRGHGQGLHLSRLVAQYLGGGLRLLEPNELPAGMVVGFRLSINPNYTNLEGMAREHT